MNTQTTNSGGVEAVADEALDDVDLEVVDRVAAEDDEGDEDDDGEEGAGADRAGAADDEDDDTELDEIEHNGKKYKVPRAIVGERLMRADYTRKTQELAKEREALATERAQHATAAEAILTDKAKLIVVDAQLQGYRELDWDALWRDNEPLARIREREEKALEREKAELESGLKTKEDDRRKASEELTLKEQRERATALQQSHAVLAKDIPGWGPELVGKVEVAINKAFGVTGAELAEIEHDPRLMKLVHAAYRQLESDKAAAKAKRLGNAQRTRPAATVGGGAPAVKDPNRMSTDDWMRHRSQQLQKKGR